MPSVVHIKAAARGEGSGVVYRADGYILTNAHVVGGAKEVAVVFHDGKEEKGQVIRDDDMFSDIAVIKVNRNNLRAAKFADSGNIRPGQIAVAIGAPFGLADSVTFGHVSGLGRSNMIPDYESPSGGRVYFNMIQTDAAINPGNSGGPLMNYRGEVIGINSAINSASGFNTGVGFALPSNTARLLGDQLIANGAIKRGYMGAIPNDLLGYERQNLGLQSGAIIRSVEPNMPADKAGLKEGDVIVELGGREIRGEQDLRDALLVNGPGKSVAVRAIRSGSEKSFTLKLTERPEIQANAAPAPSDMPEDFISPDESPNAAPSGPVQLGLSVRDLEPSETGLAPGGRGVMVVQVDANSPAEKAGVRTGVVVTRLGSTVIGSADQLRAEVAKYKKGQRTTISYGKVSGGSTQMATVTLVF
jgi:serine protease Do